MKGKVVPWRTQTLLRASRTRALVSQLDSCLSTLGGKGLSCKLALVWALLDGTKGGASRITPSGQPDPPRRSNL